MRQAVTDFMFGITVDDAPHWTLSAVPHCSTSEPDTEPTARGFPISRAIAR